MKDFFSHRPPRLRDALLPALVLLALSLRLLFLIPALGAPERLLRPDSNGYLDAAHSLAETGEYGDAVRAPGFPVLAAGVFAAGGSEKSLAVLLTVLSALTVIPVVLSAKTWAGRRAGAVAGMLFALNPTAIGNSFLMLSDTLFGLFAAFQLYFFLLFLTRKQGGWFLGSVAVSALGALIRPINLAWLPVALTLLGFSQTEWRSKWKTGAAGTLLFAALLLPWMSRNALRGEGFCIDTNTGAMAHQNGAMLLAEVRHTGYEAEKQRIRAEFAELFADRRRFPDRNSQEQYRKRCYLQWIAEHPLVWIGQHFDWKILLPDAPSLLEALGMTSPGRGTLEVLKSRGLWAGARHYFGVDLLPALAILSPLLLAAFVLLLGTIIRLAGAVRRFSRRYLEILIFLGFIEYYLFLPGAITVPRYQIPALPAACLLAGAAFACRRTEAKDER